LKVYKTQAQIVRAELRDTISKIYITYDLWTSPSRHAILAISAHFLNTEGRQQQRLLAIRQQYGSHSGINIAVTILDMLKDWEVD
jgi:hypothetical protein